MNAKKNEIVDSKSYTKFLKHIKKDIQESQLRAATSVTKELTALYWRIAVIRHQFLDFLCSQHKLIYKQAYSP